MIMMRVILVDRDPLITEMIIANMVLLIDNTKKDLSQKYGNKDRIQTIIFMENCQDQVTTNRNKHHVQTVIVMNRLDLVIDKRNTDRLQKDKVINYLDLVTGSKNKDCLQLFWVPGQIFFRCLSKI